MSTKLIRWEPFDELTSMRRDFDRLFNMAFQQPRGEMAQVATPLVDLYQTDDEVVAKLAVPGLTAEDLDIQITGDTLTIRGEMQQEEDVENATYHLRERRFSAFARSLSLPVTVVPEEAVAEIKDGILNLTLPKAEEVRPKTITVKTKK